MARTAEITFVDEVDSTNNTALDAAQQGAEHGWAVCARRQRSGRGRRGALWSSTDGGIYLSIVLRPQVSMAQFVALPAVCALGVHDVLSELGLAEFVGIKWPNDLVARVSAETPHASKLAGILVEARSGHEGPFAVAGIGLNLQPVNLTLAAHPATGVPSLPAVSLYEVAKAAGKPLPSREDLVQSVRASVVERVEAWAAAVVGPAGAAGPLGPVLSEYFDYVPMMGQQVIAVTPEGHPAAVGVLAGVDVWGRAVVRTQNEEVSLAAEAVSLRLA